MRRKQRRWERVRLRKWQVRGMRKMSNNEKIVVEIYQSREEREKERVRLKK